MLTVRKSSRSSVVNHSEFGTGKQIKGAGVGLAFLLLPNGDLLIPKDNALMKATSKKEIHSIVKQKVADELAQKQSKNVVDTDLLRQWAREEELDSTTLRQKTSKSVEKTEKMIYHKYKKNMRIKKEQQQNERSIEENLDKKITNTASSITRAKKTVDNGKMNDTMKNVREGTLKAAKKNYDESLEMFEQFKKEISKGTEEDIKRWDAFYKSQERNLIQVEKKGKMEWELKPIDDLSTKQDFKEKFLLEQKISQSTVEKTSSSTKPQEGDNVEKNLQEEEKKKEDEKGEEPTKEQQQTEVEMIENDEEEEQDQTQETTTPTKRKREENESDNQETVESPKKKSKKE